MDRSSDSSSDLKGKLDEKPVALTSEEAEREALQEELNDATWADVYQACCIKTPSEWAWGALGIFAALFTLYWFMISLELMGTSAKVLSGCRAGALFGDDTNPLSAVIIALLATALLQSSSLTTSIIVSLTGTVITVDQGIYMVMGANIGTTATNSIVSLAQMGNRDQLERAFSAAAVNDLFNFLSVFVFFPIELATNLLSRLTAACVRGYESQKGEEWEGPVKKIVSPLSDLIMKSNSKLIRAVAQGKGTCEDGGGFYPIICEPGKPTFETCPQVGLIACVEDTNRCPLFFQADADANDDKISGGVMLVLSLALMFACLVVLVTILTAMLESVSSRIIYKCTNINGYLGILIGCGLTVLVQSSSVVSSTLTPFVGVGALGLEQMYPLTLGANIGTTITGIMAALVQSGTLPLQVGLAHLFYNVLGVFTFYPIPFTRRIPLDGARFLGRMTRISRGFIFAWIAVAFMIIPMLLLFLTYMFESDLIGIRILATVITIVVGGYLLWMAFWFKFRDGRAKITKYYREREEKKDAFRKAPEHIVELQEKVAFLIEELGSKEKKALLTDDSEDNFDKIERDEEIGEQADL